MALFKGVTDLFKDEETQYIEGDETIGMHDETFDIEEVVNTTRSKSVVKLFEPVSKTSTSSIIDSVKKGELCIVDLSKVSDTEKTLIYSTLSGSMYSLDGQLKQISAEIIMCAPKNYLVDGDTLG
ncbi:MAG: cell division protein SepF [Mycoplasmatales bacterium]